jgi:hypothetical protein
MRCGTVSAHLGRLLGAGMLALAAACGLMRPDVAGTYVLESVNGRNLPVPVDGNVFRAGDSLFNQGIEEASGMISLSADRMYAGRLTIRRILCRPRCGEPGAIADDSSGRFWNGRGWDRARVGIETLRSSGTYHQRGSTIMFLSSDGYRFEAKIDGTTLRITDGYSRKVRVYRQVEDVPRD